MFMDSQLLRIYATVILEFGLKIKPEEKVLILFDENGLDLSRIITSQAYQFGASDVRYMYKDSAIEASRYKYGSNQALETFPKFEADFQLESMLAGYHSINLLSFDGPKKGIDPSKLAQYRATRSRMMADAMKLGMSNYVKWVIAPVASYNWARMVFPEADNEKALELLWKDLFNICRISEGDPIANWEKHNQSLKHHTERLNALHLQELHFKDENTDLIVGLASGHIWCGGENSTQDGAKFLSNIPTEEVYTMPNKYRVNGKVKITRPFMLFGEMIQDLVLYFEDGKVVDFQSTDRNDAITAFLHTDDGSSRLGEIALVDKYSPINQLDYPFYQILIDENACSHLALGNAYDENMKKDYSTKESAGFNESSVHLDLMIGSDEMSVEGKTKDGTIIPIMWDGTWVKG
jgi:aminopeptidase